MLESARKNVVVKNFRRRFLLLAASLGTAGDRRLDRRLFRFLFLGPPLAILPIPLSDQLQVTGPFDALNAGMRRLLRIGRQAIRGRIVRRNEHARLPVNYELGERADARRDDRTCGEHCLENCETEALPPHRMHEDRRALEPCATSTSAGWRGVAGPAAGGGFTLL